MRITLLLLFFLPFSLLSQTLKGQIIDSLGEPIPFARIKVENSTYGTVANGEGKFLLQLTENKVRIVVSAFDFTTKSFDINVLDKDLHSLMLSASYTEIEEVLITKNQAKDRAKEIMKEVIDRRAKWDEQLDNYDVNLYSFTSIEQQIRDSIRKDSIISKKKLNINELYTHSYYKNLNQYKDSILGIIDLSEKSKNSGSVSVSFGSLEENELQPQNAEESNPYLFVQGLAQADINLFKNQQMHQEICQKPIISPLAYNAFVHYMFRLERSFYNDKNEQILEINVIPRFKEEALYEGKLYIKDLTFELISADLRINRGALNYFKELNILIDYESLEGKLYPVRKEFIYLIKEGKNYFNGAARMKFSNYNFSKTEQKGQFWLANSVSDPKAFDRDSTFWQIIRPIPLKTEELLFIQQQDSIEKYFASEEYLREQDSIYNNLNIWSFLFNGVGFRNSFKKQEFFFPSLLNQVIPFGVGGYRHRFGVDYDKEFKNGKKLSLSPEIDYGFKNKDLKWSIGISHMYNPKNFAKFFLEIGDVYDFMNNYQSIQGSFAPANRVRNKKVTINHSREIINGLYGKLGVFYSKRESIENIINPDWVDVFGNFSSAAPFEGYTIFMTELDLEYHFKQKYILKKDRKIIVGTNYPVVNLTYKKGYPKILAGQSDFDYLELRLEDNINLKQFGKTDVKFIAGQFLRKKDLRIVEYKFFRTSDAWFFSNPLNSLQKLDTALSTSNNFIQLNYIHHFEGFFLNKVWGLNKLKLQETVGGSFLAIPESNFAQVEFYVGLERQIRIRKQLFKLGFYAVTSGSTFDKANISYKFGINFYNSFYKKWDY